MIAAKTKIDPKLVVTGMEFSLKGLQADEEEHAHHEEKAATSEEDK